MDLISIATIIGSVLIPVVGMVYTMIRNTRRDSKTEQDKITVRVAQSEKDSTKHDESFKRVHMRMDNLEADQDKLETTVENKLDKLEGKIDRIHDLMLERNNNRKD